MKLLGAALGALFVLVFLRSGPPAPRYFMVDELVMSELWLDGQTVKVHGWVEAGSIVDTPTVTRFVLQKDGKHLRVVLLGPRPDTLKDLSEVVLLGRLDKDVLHASEVMMRCASDYRGSSNAKNVDKPFQ